MRDQRAAFARQPERRERALAHDHRVHELDGDVAGVGLIDAHVVDSVLVGASGGNEVVTPFPANSRVRSCRGVPATDASERQGEDAHEMRS
jgi:hypothetical protein